MTFHEYYNWEWQNVASRVAYRISGNRIGLQNANRARCMRFRLRLLQTLLGRNLRHVDLAIRTGTNTLLFYSLAFGQLTRLDAWWFVDVTGITERSFYVFCVRSLRCKGVTAFIRAACPLEGFLSAMSRSRATSQYFVAIFRPQPVDPHPVLFVSNVQIISFSAEKKYI